MSNDETTEQVEQSDPKQKRVTIKDLEVQLAELKDDVKSKDALIAKADEQIQQLQSDFTRINKQNNAGQMIQRFSIINERINNLASAIVCILLTNCRSINDIGWETILKRYWRTTGSVVFPEDKEGLKQTLDNEDPLEVIQKFMDMSFNK